MWTPFKEIDFPSEIKVDIGDKFNNYLVKKKIYVGVNSVLYLLEKDTKHYLLKLQNNLDIDGFLSWQNEARFISLRQDDRFVFPVEDSHIGLVFNYYPLKDFRSFIYNREFSISKKISFLVHLLYAIGCMHSIGVVHHDLKPENILWDHKTNDIKLLDFGFAWIEGRDDFWKDTILPKGTPDYIAPEGLKGVRGKKASDVYSFGVIAYEFLTGTLPFFKAKSSLGTSLRKWQKIKPLSEYDLGIPPELAEIIMHCLQKDYTKRPEILELAEIFSYVYEKEFLLKRESFVCTLKPGGDPLVKKGYLEGKPLVCCFLRPDAKLKPLLAKGMSLAKEGYGVVFISFVPETLTSFEQAEYKAKLFQSLAKTLPEFRRQNLSWGIRIWKTSTPAKVALEVLKRYEPQLVVLGESTRGKFKNFFKPGLNKKIRASDFASRAVTI